MCRSSGDEVCARSQVAVEGLSSLRTKGERGVELVRSE
jgi:hypothetical protein